MTLQLIQSPSVDSFQPFLNDINRNGGPTTDQFSAIDDLLLNLQITQKMGHVSRERIRKVAHYLATQYSGTTLSRSFLKPYGYAGDFAIIDQIYTQPRFDNPRAQAWEKYVQNTPACKAVRNRKKYFITEISKIIHEKGRIHLLNLASGPARDLLELFRSLPNPELLQVTCIEMDDRAIAYAQELLGSYNKQVRFINKNVFRYKPETTFDVVWSAGLFDYFDDKGFAILLRRIQTWLKEEGNLIIGNFNEDHNPSRPLMELMGEWYLNHRSEYELIELATNAGFKNIHVGREEENVNLFLHATK